MHWETVTVILTGPEGSAAFQALAEFLAGLGAGVTVCARFEEATERALAGGGFAPVIAFGEAASCAAIADYKRTNPNGVVLAVCSGGEAKALSDGDIFHPPFRLGALAARLEWHRRRQERLGGLPPMLSLGPRTLDLQENRLLDPASGSEIRLTEKERDILVALFRGGRKGLDRKTLLQQVWRYADGVETHTLETHIYRLRQKIEKDPANPELVCTSEKGYMLGIFR